MSLITDHQRSRPGRHRSSIAALCALLVSLCSAAPSLAHHGRDFLLARTASLPHRGNLYVIPRQDYVDHGDEDEIELEPTLFYGIVDRLGLEVHAHVAREGSESFTYESTAPSFQIRFNDPESSWGFGMSAEYEIAAHGDEPDVASALLIVSRSMQRSKLAFNVFAEKVQESDTSVEWSYAAGWRHRLSPIVDLGLEVMGNIEEPGDLEGLFGVYVDPGTWYAINVGVGTGFGDAEVDLSVRSSLVFRVK